MTVKKEMRNDKTRKFNIPEWCNFDCCPRIISGAIQDCCKAYKTAFSLLKKGIIKKFQMHYKTKKDLSQSLFMEKSCFSKKNNSILPGKYKLGFLKINSRDKSNFKTLNINHDVRLKLTNNKWDFLLPQDVLNESQVQSSDIVGIDPGVRTFLTAYDPSGKIIEIGSSDYKRIFKHLKESDFIRSKRDQTESKKRRKSLSSALKKKGVKIRNLIEDMQWKAASYLSKNYSKIYFGDIQTKSLLTKAKCYKRTKRLLCSFRFFDFKKKLREKCGDRLVLVNESWTSKTCGGCQTINHKLGSNETFNCDKCNILIGRDINAARNILVKGLLMGATPL